ncbi:MAG: tRNA (N6-isopentenyl adenosine(37)-C2)-methylthiotransferase MiaB [Nitrospirae bacterium RBG_13_39_12]|nr:MAG: tRNA (N6-isopentenyl adenosine(37)-C2)-methylthiotransferase MiaB [Nitrospirae bacterium RBG_13_39_12]
MSKKVYLKTWGCQMNVHDSEKMLGILKEEGYSQSDNPFHADLIILNTCSIREKAERKFYSELGRIKAYKNKRPDINIAVAGCIAQKEGRAIFKKASYVDFIFGPQNIHILKDFVSGTNLHISTEENPRIAETDLPVKRADSIKAWITIMYGCNNFCSYCIVPYTRGRERSRPSKNILSEAEELASKGYKEITLLGQNVNSYKYDTDFPGLLRKLNRVGGLERIRFITSHPKDLSDELIDAIFGLPKVCEHIHLPIQSGSDNILRLMRRGYTYADYIKKVSRLREKVPGIAITSDVITGFPGESHADHVLTLKAIKEIEFDGLFAFKFSKRPGTKTFDMEGCLNEKIKSERLSEILSIQDRITSRKNRLLEGTKQEIMIGGYSDTDKEKLTGRTRTNKIVNVPKFKIERGSLIIVEITKGKQHSLEAISLEK